MSKKKTTIALDQVRTLKYSINAMIELEERFNVAIPSLLVEGNIGFGLIIAILRIGLIHGGMRIPGKTPKDQELFVGDLVQEHWIEEGKKLDELMGKVTEAFNTAGIITTRPEDAENQEEGQNPNEGTAEEPVT